MFLPFKQTLFKSKTKGHSRSKSVIETFSISNDIPVTFADDPNNRTSLKVIKKFSQGKFPVYHVYSTTHRTSYAFKVFPKTSFGIAQYKKEALISKLHHQNIIENIPITCHNDQFFTFVTAFADHGSLLDAVINDKISSEIIARTYFHQLIDGLTYIHSQGVAHLDLKLENLLLSSDFSLKIIDFDQAQPIRDRHVTSSGTPDYRAPEILKKNCRNLEAIDTFSAGIILYILRAGEFPFLESREEDKENGWTHSKFIENNSSFWTTKNSAKGNENFFGEKFMNLVNGMLNENPDKRFKIQRYQGIRMV